MTTNKYAETARAWADRNRDHLRDYQRRWRRANREKVQASVDRGRPKLTLTATPHHLSLDPNDPTRLKVIGDLARALRSARATDFRHDAQGFGFSVQLQRGADVEAIRAAVAGHYQVEVMG